MVPKLPLSAEIASERRNVRKKLFFQTAISRELSDWDAKNGSQIEDFCQNLFLSPFLSKSLHTGVQEKGKSFGADLPHPGCYKVQKVPGWIGLRLIRKKLDNPTSARLRKASLLHSLHHIAILIFSSISYALSAYFSCFAVFLNIFSWYLCIHSGVGNRSNWA